MKDLKNLLHYIEHTTQDMADGCKKAAKDPDFCQQLLDELGIDSKE